LATDCTDFCFGKGRLMLFILDVMKLMIRVLLKRYVEEFMLRLMTRKHGIWRLKECEKYWLDS